jgi:AraC-like DNA-binding protein
MFPENERFSAFREEFVRRRLALDVINHSGGGGCPRADFSVMALDRATYLSIETGPTEFIRQRHHLKDGRGDSFTLALVRGDPIHFGHAGGELHRLEAGSAAFCDQGRPWRLIGRGNIDLKMVTVDAAALRTLVPAPGDLAGIALRPGPALRLLEGYVHSVAELDEAPPPGLAPVMGGHLLDLVAAVLGRSRDAAETIEKRGVKAARLRAVVAAITDHFSDPGFTVDDLARAAGVSRRYAQGLLEETGKSFTEHVLERRLEHAVALLRDPRNGHLPIINIAYTSGFGDVSHFNRVFRKRHGDTPSGVRAAAARLSSRG